MPTEEQRATCAHCGHAIVWYFDRDEDAQIVDPHGRWYDAERLTEDCGDGTEVRLTEDERAQLRYALGTMPGSYLNPISEAVERIVAERIALARSGHEPEHAHR